MVTHLAEGVLFFSFGSAWFTFYTIQTVKGVCFASNCSSTASPGLLSKNYAQIAQHFGLPFPKLPNISFANVGKQCKETVEKLSTSKLAYPYLDAIGKPQSGLFVGNLGWLGSYSECTKSIVNAHYCLAFVAVPTFNITEATPIRWGICAPKQCSEEDVTYALQDIFTGLNKEYNQTLARLIPEPVAFAAKDSHSKPVFCNKKSEYTAGVIMTLILCGLILFLCLVGTIIDIVVNFRKSHSSPVNKSDGFMPIRNVSIVADHNQASHVQNPLAKSDPDSDKTNLLQSSHDVNFSASITLSNFHQEPARPNVVVQFFLCFSLIQNTRLIMDTKVPSTAITSINGMRVLSMWWVILGHTYSIQTMATPLSNLLLAYDIIHRFTFQTVGNATFSVDSFFFLSGLLVAYLSLRRMEKKNGQLPLFKYYFHRFWRLTPTYMFVLLFFHTMTGFLGEGPFWYEVQTETQCSKYWWTNLLYINNFYPTSFAASCMGWAWYLANDMQFYIIAPAILFTAYRFRLPGLLAITGVLAGISFITTAVLYAHYDLDAVSLANQCNYCDDTHYNILTVSSCKVHTYLFNMAGWCVAIILALSTLYGEYKVLRKDNPQPFSRAENIIYGTFSRCAWSLALAWVIFACHRGLGGLVDRILSARFWIPLSRLTYCAYLVHIIALIVLSVSYETVQAYSDVHTAFCFVGVVAISYAAAFIVSVCVEFPMMQLEKLIFKSDR
ncbi:nose resistant to fluoxetine protein 6-like [Orbicella faveolata]|uniref:nose resistant to fluoxetine protein 6-like n=1 Tax=Orbicella faveolata TaxID=48498 RepID=UPI0009E57030|nr:nose resistant to fluoxetine protein 6-like [Orbicella faveolata]